MDPKTKRALFAATSIIAAGQLTVAAIQNAFPPAHAQQSFPTHAVTGNEIMDDLSNPTGGFFTINQLGTYDRIIAGHLSVTGSSSTVTNCGTSPAIVGTDTAWQVIMGTGSPVTCSVLFASAYVKSPICSVDWTTNLALTSYATTTNTVVLTQTSNSSSVVNGICIGQAGG